MQTLRGTPLKSIQCATRDPTARPRPPRSPPAIPIRRRDSTSGLSTIWPTATKAAHPHACKKSMQHSDASQSEVTRGPQHVTSMHNSSHIHNQHTSGLQGIKTHAPTAAISQSEPATTLVPELKPRARPSGSLWLLCSWCSAPPPFGVMPPSGCTLHYGGGKEHMTTDLKSRKS